MSVFNNEHRRQFKDVSTSYVIVAATDYTTPSQKIAGKSKHTIYIQKIMLAVTTDNAATQTFQSVTTDAKVATTKASPGLGPIEFDFGEEGYALPEGEGLEHLMSAAGMAASVTITAYQKLTGVTDAATFATL